MAAVYKTLSGSSEKPNTLNGTTVKKNKQRVLILSSRGVTYRQRHLLNDLHVLLPHSRKDVKLDTKTKLYQLNELADMYNCNNILFFEARKGKDLYIWMSKAPNGPTLKFHCQNQVDRDREKTVHTTSELHFPGNCLRGSRPILSFDATFDTAPHLALIKELLRHIFGVPKGARRSKPFIDHVMGFTVADGKVWVRCFEIRETATPKSEARSQRDNERNDSEAATVVIPGDKERGETKISLVEIGPRFVLTPIMVQESSFGGPIIYENKEYVSPNQVRAELRLAKAGRYARRSERDTERTTKKGGLGLTTAVRDATRNELDDAEIFR
ncbi:MAG: hypothetical protein LQ342_005068 [Letrouitia transgressa]|nr:MAG: hypothetical protein LQ342_005068 [Letrouitia transgressa]